MNHARFQFGWTSAMRLASVDLLFPQAPCFYKSVESCMLAAGDTQGKNLIQFQ